MTYSCDKVSGLNSYVMSIKSYGGGGLAAEVEQKQ